MRHSTRFDRTRRSGRAGFTLIELLVVVAIIAVLASLAVVAAIKLIGTQEESNTKQTLGKVQRELDKAWKAEVDEADRTFATQCPQGVMLMAGGDVNRAKVIWRKLWMVRAFPTAYVEIQYFNPNRPPAYQQGGPFALPAYPGPYIVVFNGTPYPINPGPRPSYVAAFNARQAPAPSPPAAAPGGWNTPPGWPPNTPPPPPQAYVVPQPPPSFAEYGACLYIALSSSRRGVALDTASLGSTSIRDTDGDSLNEIVDGWGTPVVYYRSPAGNPKLPPSPGGDPLDPENRLMDPSWNNATMFQAQQGVYWFELLFHPIHTGNSPNNWVPTPFYTTPVVVSAGSNKLLGLASPIWPTPNQATPFAIGMAPDQNPPSGDEDDNLYSWPPGK